MGQLLVGTGRHLTYSLGDRLNQVERELNAQLMFEHNLH